MLQYDADTSKLYDPQLDLVFADRPYYYALSGKTGSGETIVGVRLSNKLVTHERDSTVITGVFDALGIELRQVFHRVGKSWQETITLRNTASQPVMLEDICLGFTADLSIRPDWHLCAIPFRVQLDGSLHDFSTQALVGGKFSNAVYTDPTRWEPPLSEESRLRSEAWAWMHGEQGLVVIKYNNRDIELSVAAPMVQGDEVLLRFGGAGLCLYSEPTRSRRLAPGEDFTFGTCVYISFAGGLRYAFARYRDFLDSHSHGFPPVYDPPVNWNELYDIGWYHSDAEKLRQNYTRAALLREADAARDCGCDLLYLDPGWEVAEGTTLWDESRLGTVESLAVELKRDYGLDLGYRTILRCYRDGWPHEYLVRRPGKEHDPVPWVDQQLWELCLCHPGFWQEKLRRILEISRQGVRFMMVDEMDWRGPCEADDHGHPVPTTPLDHTLAVYGLCREIRRQCPGLTIEAHDPIWPWHTAIYVPTYFQQGFGVNNCYDENWGFEYMWDCIKDLKSGKALALYYYNLGCNIPLYLHITMAADNDHCLFFWWAASTVRHLGIGGKYSHKTVEPPQGLPYYDPEKRFAAYQEQMRLYKRLKPYYVRGTFHGLAENIHLHTLPDSRGGVLNVYNLTDTDQDYSIHLPADLLHIEGEATVSGAFARWNRGDLELEVKLKALSPVIICIGDAVPAE